MTTKEEWIEDYIKDAKNRKEVQKADALEDAAGKAEETVTRYELLDDGTVKAHTITIPAKAPRKSLKENVGFSPADGKFYRRPTAEEADIAAVKDFKPDIEK